MGTRTVQIAKNGLKNENVAATKLKIFIKNLEISKFGIDITGKIKLLWQHRIL